MTMHIFNCDWSRELTIIWSTTTQPKALINLVVNSNLIEIRYLVDCFMIYISPKNIRFDAFSGTLFQTANQRWGHKLFVYYNA